jgi:hypothetical protein
MNTKNQQSKQMNQHGHQNQVPKKGQDPNDPQNRQAVNSQKLGVNDTKEGEQRQGIGTPHDRNERQPGR